jgi:hypothetical protein
MIVDSSAPTTLAQMRLVDRYMDRHRQTRVAAVASRLQMPRISALAGAMRRNIALIAAPVDHEPPTRGLWRWLPSIDALAVTRDAIYERAALRYYHSRGWIRD